MFLEKKIKRPCLDLKYIPKYVNETETHNMLNDKKKQLNTYKEFDF
jgi:hypothetical protein